MTNTNEDVYCNCGDSFTENSKYHICFMDEIALAKSNERKEVLRLIEETRRKIEKQMEAEKDFAELEADQHIRSHSEGEACAFEWALEKIDELKQALQQGDVSHAKNEG